MAALAASGACGPSTPEPRGSVDAIPIVGDAVSQSYASPAHWVFQPNDAQAVFAHQALDDGTCVLAGASGHRYLTAPPEPDEEPCSGAAQVAAFPAPEDLVDVVYRGSAGWLFVGRSGALYEAEQALDAFHRRILPPKPLVEVATGGKTLLAVASSGELFRFGEGSSWTPVAIDAAKSARFFDVAIDARGHAIAVATPEVLVLSDDGGKTWRPAASLPTPPGKLGVRRIGLSRKGLLVVETTTGPRVWQGGDAAFEPTGEVIAQVGSTGPLRPGPSRSIGAVLDRRAALTGDRYYQVLRSDEHWDHDDDGKWLLVTGGLEGPLQTEVVDDEEACSEMYVGARGETVIVGCMVDGRRDLRLHLRRSFDAGQTFEPAGSVDVADESRLHIAVASDGGALLTGVCSPDEDGVCVGGASVAVLAAPGQVLKKPAADDAKHGENEKAEKSRDEKKDDASATKNEEEDEDRGEIVQARAPHAASQAVMPAISPDGATMYFLARRNKDGRVSLFLSFDGGLHFEPRPLDIPMLFSGRDQGVIGLDEIGYDLVGELQLDMGSVCIDEDGTLGMTLEEPEGYLYVSADEDGRVLRAARTPSHDATMAGCGSRVLSVGRADPDGSVDEDAMHAWESLDGGATWTDLTATSALASVEAMACATGGCVIGDEISRVGWGGQRETQGAHYASSLPQNNVPAVGAPLVCELDADAPWERIDHVHFTQADGLPTLSNVMRGDAVWSKLSWASPDGAVIAVSAQRGGPKKHKNKGVRLVRETMLGPAKASTQSTQVLPQMEGYAAYRVTVPNGEARPPSDQKIGRTEIVWESYLEGISGRRTLPSSTTYGEISLSRQPWGWAARLGLLSITPGGILVRPGILPSKSPNAYFLDPKKKTQTWFYPDWATLGVDAAVGGDAARVGDVFFATGHVDQTPRFAGVALFAHKTESSTELVAETVSPPLGGVGLRGETRWTYDRGALAMTRLLVAPEDGEAWASLRRFGADGHLEPPRPLPTPYDLGGAARPCTDDERRNTPRLQVPMLGGDGEALFPGMRHPVVAFEAIGLGALAPMPPTPMGRHGRFGLPSQGPTVLLTTGLVLHGSKDNPCIAGWHARETRRHRRTTAVIPGNLDEPGWLFRVAPTSSSNRAIEVRRMTCRLDPLTAIPDEVWAEPGTFLQRR